MSGKKILMLTGEFTEEYEIFVFQKGMEAVGHTVHVVCPDKAAGEMIRTSLHDFEGHQTYLERYGHLAEINKTFAEVDPAEYDAVYCAGGRGPSTSAPTRACRRWSGTSTTRRSRSSPSATGCRSSSPSTAW